jgi:pimeloyl-ACP methyl ester carboxylesterase
MDKTIQELIQERHVPEILFSEKYGKIDTVEDWETKRKPELKKIILEEEYGYPPDIKPEDVTIRLLHTAHDPKFMGARAKRTTYEIEAVRKDRNFCFEFVLVTPAEVKKPVPCFILISNRGISSSDPARQFLSPFYPIEQILARGYATAFFLTQDVAPDYYEGYTSKIHRLFPEYGENRPDTAYATIGAWSWATSRIMDALADNPVIDSKAIAVVGHSRGGKTALLTGALDERVALVCSSCAGNSGDALARGSTGERLLDINEGFPYWFDNNYKKYNNNEDAMPFDQHMLLSLIAPRHLYTTSRSLDAWADPAGQFMSLVLADEVYRLYGVEGLEQYQMPLPEHPLHQGHIAYHMKTGAHNLDEYDWHNFMDYADGFMKA